MPSLNPKRTSPWIDVDVDFRGSLASQAGKQSAGPSATPLFRMSINVENTDYPTDTTVEPLGPGDLAALASAAFHPPGASESSNSGTPSELPGSVPLRVTMAGSSKTLHKTGRRQNSSCDSCRKK